MSAVGSAAHTTGYVDNMLTLLLSAILHQGPPNSGYDYGLASIIFFTARSMEQRKELIFRLFQWRCERALDAPRHTNKRRSADFMMKLLRTVFENHNKNRWIRNLAAHGDVVRVEGVGLILTPTILNDDGREHPKLKIYGGVKGLNAEDIRAAVAPIGKDVEHFRQLQNLMPHLYEWRPYPEQFLQLANSLADELGITRLRLHDPSQGKPRRERRQRSQK